MKDQSIISKGLRELASALERRGEEDGREEITLYMADQCGCVAGFLGRGNYDRGLNDASKIFGDYGQETEAALCEAGILDTGSCGDYPNMFGATASFYIPRETDRFKEKEHEHDWPSRIGTISLKDAIAALRDYADKYETWIKTCHADGTLREGAGQ